MKIKPGQIWVRDDRARIVVAVLKRNDHKSFVRWRCRGQKQVISQSMETFVEWASGAVLMPYVV